MTASAREVETKDTRVGTLMLRIRDGKWRRAVEAVRQARSKDDAGRLKKGLPAVLWSGTFSRRGKAYLAQHSGLLCADLDRLGDRLASVRAALLGSPYLSALFISPSGSGLKAVFRVPADATRHAASFGAVKRHVLQLTGARCDEACKDVARLCFVSWDEAAVHRPNPEEMPMAAQEPEPAPVVGSRAVRGRVSGGNGAAADLTLRRRIASEVLGAVEWRSDVEGLCECPGKARHTTRNAQTDCRVHLDGAPTLHCFHGSCRDAVEAANHRLRAAISVAERATSKAPRVVAISAARGPVVVDAGVDALTAEVRGFIVATLLGDLAPAAKRTAIARGVVQAMLRRGAFYHHAERRDFDSALFFDRTTKRLEPIRSHGFQAWLSAWLAVNRADYLFRYVQADVETAALEGDTTAILPESYWASRPGVLYLSNGDGSLVRIDRHGYTLADNGADGVLFAAGRTLEPWRLVEPHDALAACRVFADAKFTGGHGHDLFRAWVYSLPSNPRSKPPLCLAGEIGSGKTRVAKAVAELFGLPLVIAKVQEDAEDDFWPTLDGGGLFILDNADTRCRWLSDAVATASTDGCVTRRKLYTNSETVRLRANAWLALTTMNPTFASDAGLADRLLPLRMARREGQTADADLTAEIEAHRDAGLSHIAWCLSAAVADTAPTPAGLNQRHPDFATFAVRLGRALGREEETAQALRAAEADKSAFCLENDQIGAALIAYLRDSAVGFTGPAAELVPHLAAMDTELGGRLTARRLGKRLVSMWPHIEARFPQSGRELDRKGITVFKIGTAGYAGF